eukprot:1082618-Alexandrium_andersonii.AAC.1
MTACKLSRRARPPAFFSSAGEGGPFSTACMPSSLSAPSRSAESVHEGTMSWGALCTWKSCPANSS